MAKIATTPRLFWCRKPATPDCERRVESRHLPRKPVFERGALHTLRRDGHQQPRMLGLDTLGQTTPPAEGNFVQVVAAGNHGCGLSDAGAVSCWGQNTGEGNSLAIPGDLPALVVLAAGNEHVCGLDASGGVHCWGDDDEGQVSDAPAGTVFTTLAAGASHTCSITQTGSVSCWGAGVENTFSDPDHGQSASPMGNGFTAVAAGGYHSCALKIDGTVICWGEDANDKLTPAGTVLPYVFIGAGAEHTCGITIDWHVQCWGNNDNGKASAPSDLLAIYLTAGREHSCAVSADGSTTCWGAGLENTGNPNFGQAAGSSAALAVPVFDLDNCPEDANPDQTDSNNDRVGDACSADADGDGVDGELDCDDTSEDYGAIVDDVDCDGFVNTEDNCPEIENSDQTDTDEDGPGDACDVEYDGDGDGVYDGPDNCPEDANQDQTDSNNDGVGDACSSDADGDGVDGELDCDDTTADLGAIADDTDCDGTVNATDNCPETPNADQANLDGDAQGDACDPESDGDGLTRDVELANGLDPLNADSDGDGYPDNVEWGCDASGCPETPRNTDGTDEIDGTEH